jgi:hypothetical protein
MLIIPEIETVVILVPRTGSGSLRRAIAAKYPESMLLYRHMEADGVPAGYDRWKRIGVVREPVARMWSMYKFLRQLPDEHAEGRGRRLRQTAERPFEDWLLNNETVFTTPHDDIGAGRFWPGFAVRHNLPENRKSQFLYLRPDLGTRLFSFADLAGIARHLDVDFPAPQNKTESSPPPTLSEAAENHIAAWFAWDTAASAAATAAIDHRHPRQIAYEAERRAWQSAIPVAS